MKDKILEYLSEIRPEVDFANSSDYIRNGYLDSFDLVTLVTTLDEDLNISIEGVDIIPANFSSLENIEALINKYKSTG
jgi:acyl carrier protein